MSLRLEVRRSPVAALLYGTPIGLLGAEFRLPVLAGVFRYPARRAVALNLAISLITVVSALLIRGSTLSLAPLVGLLPIVVAMIIGAVSAAYVGTALVHRVSERLLERVILVFLVAIGSALIVEAFLPQDVPGLLPDALPVRVVAAAVFGLGIGLVSSLLGVAGGELIIPTLLFALPTVAVGVFRHRKLGSFAERADLTQTVAPMGAGSVIGAVAGGLFVGVVPAAALKFVLGVILIVSAVRIFRGH